MAVWFRTLNISWQRLGLQFRGALSGPSYLLLERVVPSSRLKVVPVVKWQDIVPLLSSW